MTISASTLPDKWRTLQFALSRVSTAVSRSSRVRYRCHAVDRHGRRRGQCLRSWRPSRMLREEHPALRPSLRAPKSLLPNTSPDISFQTMHKLNLRMLVDDTPKHIPVTRSPAFTLPLNDTADPGPRWRVDEWTGTTHIGQPR